jgi:hypothetical protein
VTYLDDLETMTATTHSQCLAHARGDRATLAALLAGLIPADAAAAYAIQHGFVRKGASLLVVDTTIDF